MDRQRLITTAQLFLGWAKQNEVYAPTTQLIVYRSHANQWTLLETTTSKINTGIIIPSHQLKFWAHSQISGTILWWLTWLWTRWVASYQQVDMKTEWWCTVLQTNKDSSCENYKPSAYGKLKDFWGKCPQSATEKIQIISTNGHTNSYVFLIRTVLKRVARITLTH